MFSAVGPIFGYGGGAWQLTKWVDFDTVPEPDLKTSVIGF